ncbi:MAG: L-rhamnose mutarotase [Chloroflexi bacterium]|nr:L-rhamnose mutarotase [Chloroflexota bacterium]
MKSYAKTLLLQDDPEKIEAYQRYHQAVWPEVLAALRGAGIIGMKIYLLGRRMFMYMTTTDDFDPQRSMAGYERQPRVQEWEGLMRTMQERAPEAPPDQWWADMELVFDMDWPQHRPRGEER